MKKWYLVIDVEKCENCNNCVLACKDEHVNNDWPGYCAPQPDHGQKWMNIQGIERGRFPNIDVAYLPAPCMHCDNAPCLKAAGAEVVHKRPDGIVIIDPVKAKGKKKIVEACPYGAIWWNEKLELPQKCTLCAHLLDQGWTKTRCVQSCPTGALNILHLEESEMQHAISKEHLETYLPERQTQPHVFYKNLYRFTRCFIAGSAAITLKGKTECAENAKVSLLDSSGKAMAETDTDNYGDFKFDNLPENSGQYQIRLSLQGYQTRTVNVTLGKSINAGTISLTEN